MKTHIEGIVWDLTLCGPLKVIRHFGGIYRLHALFPNGFMQIFFFASAYFSTPKMEAVF
jgi:hypothetical protein